MFVKLDLFFFMMGIELREREQEENRKRTGREQEENRNRKGREQEEKRKRTGREQEENRINILVELVGGKCFGIECKNKEVYWRKVSVNSI